MTKEQAIEKIKWSIHINELTKDINGNNTSINVEVLKTVLSMLEEKDKEIQFQEDINKTELNRHKKTEKGQIIKQNKMIDLMTEYIEDELTVDEFCTKEGCYADNYIDGHCEKCLNCIKQYFENKVKERR